MEQLTVSEKIFCECLSLILASWWLLLAYLIYLLRDYLVIGLFVLLGISVGIALLEKKGDS